MMRGIKLCFSPKFSEVTFNYSAEYFSLDGADSKVSLSPLYLQIEKNLIENTIMATYTVSYN